MKELLELCEFIDENEKLESNVVYWKKKLSFKGVIVKENTLEKAVEKMKVELNRKINEELVFEDIANFNKEVY